MNYIIIGCWCWWSSIPCLLYEGANLLALEPVRRRLILLLPSPSNVFLMIISTRPWLSFCFPLIQNGLSKCDPLLLGKLPLAFQAFLPVSDCIIDWPRDESLWLGVLINEVRSAVLDNLGRPGPEVEQGSVWHPVTLDAKDLAGTWGYVRSLHVWANNLLDWERVPVDEVSLRFVHWLGLVRLLTKCWTSYCTVNWLIMQPWG